MRKQEVINHAREVLERDMAAIPDEYPGMPGRPQDWPATMDSLYDIRKASVDGFTLSATSPRPAIKVVEGAFKDLARSSSQTRLQFVEESFLPLAETGLQTPTHKMHISARGKALACYSAEYSFSDSLKQVRSSRYYNQDRISIYHDREGRPLLFRKTNDESTALNLAPLVWGAAVVPAGTIVAVDKVMNQSPTGQVARRHFNLATYLVPEEVIVTPARLSAWAYEDPLDRAMFGLKGKLLEPCQVDYERDRVLAVAKDSLADFVDAARKVIERCVD